MAVSINRIRKDINEILKTLGERVVLFPDKAIEITNKVNEIIDMYRDSCLLYLVEENLSKDSLEELTRIINDAVKINTEYEKFLKMVGLSRMD
jgi:ArsR family metal-binding transcriptional regulator